VQPIVLSKNIKRVEEKIMSKQILRIDASMRKNGSYSRKLSDSLIEQLNKREQHKLTVRDLSEGVPFINESWIGANFTDVGERTPEQRAVLSRSDALVNELQEADIIVIGLPIYNFGAPAAFKAWIDLVARAKLTFKYTDNGPVGLLENKKAYIVIASGGTQVGSEIDFVSNYVRFVLGFIGINDLTFIDSSGISRDEKTVLAYANEAIAVI
jgi:FMN-dependent NADH-azoreductase